MRIYRSAGNEILAVSTALLSSVNVTTAYRMFGIEVPSEVGDVDPVRRHARLIQENIHNHVQHTNPVRGLVMMVVKCLELWSNCVCAHHVAASDMVKFIRKLIQMKLNPGCGNCTPLLLALASTFEVLVMFAGPGWLQVYMDSGSDALFKYQLQKVAKCLEGMHSGGLKSKFDCSSLISDFRVDGGVTMVREYTLSILKALEGADSSAGSPRRISSCRPSPRWSQQRAVFITQLCMIFTSASATVTGEGVRNADDMEREVEIVLRERRQVRYLFTLLMKDLGFRGKQQKMSLEEVDEVHQRLENVFRGKVHRKIYVYIYNCNVTQSYPKLTVTPLNTNRLIGTKTACWTVLKSTFLWPPLVSSSKTQMGLKKAFHSFWITFSTR